MSVSHDPADRIGDAAVRRGWITRARLDECVRLQRALLGKGNPVRLAALLVQNGLLTREQVVELLQAQGKDLRQCPACRRTFNVPRNRSSSGPHCPHCRGPLAPVAPGGEIDAAGSWIFETAAVRRGTRSTAIPSTAGPFAPGAQEGGRLRPVPVEAEGREERGWRFRSTRDRRQEESRRRRILAGTIAIVLATLAAGGIGVWVGRTPAPANEELSFAPISAPERPAVAAGNAPAGHTTAAAGSPAPSDSAETRYRALTEFLSAHEADPIACLQRLQEARSTLLDTRFGAEVSARIERLEKRLLETGAAEFRARVKRAVEAHRAGRFREAKAALDPLPVELDPADHWNSRLREERGSIQDRIVEAWRAIPAVARDHARAGRRAKAEALVRPFLDTGDSEIDARAASLLAELTSREAADGSGPDTGETATPVGPEPAEVDSAEPLAFPASARLAGTCLACEGKRTVRCGTCGGRARSTFQCAFCLGQRRIPCRGCAQAGKRSCPACDGSKIARVLTTLDGVPLAQALEEPCLYCERKGTVTCAVCHGNGFETCRHCPAIGTRSFECPECGGAGDTPCRSCSPETTPCHSCKGGGDVPCPLCAANVPPFCSECRGARRAPCTACSAHGNLVCKSCGGAGYLYKLARYIHGKYEKEGRSGCKDCTRTGRIRCGSCAGSGLGECAACATIGREACWWCRGRERTPCRRCLHVLGRSGRSADGTLHAVVVPLSAAWPGLAGCTEKILRGDLRGVCVAIWTAPGAPPLTVPLAHCRLRTRDRETGLAAARLVDLVGDLDTEARRRSGELIRLEASWFPEPLELESGRRRVIVIRCPGPDEAAFIDSCRALEVGDRSIPLAPASLGAGAIQLAEPASVR